MWISVFLIVLAASIVDATLTIEGTMNGSTFYALDGRVENLTCSHSGIELPLATLTWNCYNGAVRDISNDTVARAEVTWTANRAENETQCTCLSSHPVAGSIQVYVNVRILYPPTAPTVSIDNVLVTGTTVYAIQNFMTTVRCNSEGYPSPSYIWNTTESTYNGQNLRFYVQTSKDGNYTCIVMNTMRPTYGEEVVATNGATITFETLVPPNSVQVQYNGSSGPFIISTLAVLRGTSFSLFCSANGNPEPSYRWEQNYIPFANGSMLNVSHIETSHSFRCIASNLLLPSNGYDRNASSITTISVTVLYPPTVRSFSNYTIVENQTFSMNCYIASYGNPKTTNYIWTRLSTNETFVNQTLPSTNVNRQHAGIYRCTASNTMNTTFDGVKQGVDSQTFELTVQYPATIVNFTFDAVSSNNPYTVDEFSHITMACNVDSVPDARITLSRGDTEVASETSATLATYTIDNATCLDAGLYTCAASNQHNSDGGPTTSRQLLVRCPPRAHNTANNLTYARALGQSITLSLSFLAYPEPFSYNWQKLHSSGAWSDLTTGVTSDASQSNITLQNIQPADFGQYRVKVINPLGILEHMFFLSAEDEPQIPTDISIASETVTENSAVLSWIKGFNGGLEQTFHIEYKAESATTWDAITAQDSNTAMLRATIAGLLPATVYMLRMYAQNNIGASAKSDTITFTTKGPPRALETTNNFTYYLTLGQSVTLSLKFMANPEPFAHQWFKLQTEDTWTELMTGISSNAGQSDLTIQSLQPVDFGQYRVHIINALGILEHMFFVAARDKPQNPTRISIPPETVTENSAVIHWIKGFNGGFEQTFHIQYKAESATTWEVITVEDSYEASLRATLVGLRPATNYTVRLYTRNAIGASLSDNFYFKTNALPEEPSASPAGAIVGGILGVAVVAAIVVALVITQRKYQWTNVLRTIPEKLRKRQPTKAMDDIEKDNQLSAYEDVVTHETGKSSTEMSEVDTDTTGYQNLPARGTAAREYENVRKTAGGMKQVETGKSHYESLHHTKSQKKLYDSLKKNTGEGGTDGNNRTDYENLKKVNRGNKPKIAAKPKKQPVYENLKKK